MENFDSEHFCTLWSALPAINKACCNTSVYHFHSVSQMLSNYCPLINCESLTSNSVSSSFFFFFYRLWLYLLRSVMCFEIMCSLTLARQCCPLLVTLMNLALAWSPASLGALFQMAHLWFCKPTHPGRLGGRVPIPLFAFQSGVFIFWERSHQKRDLFTAAWPA